MFSIGDKVVYPMQGIGIIQRIENRTFSGKDREYTIIKILSNNLEIMIPSDKLPDSNLRKICDISTLENILLNLTNKIKEPISISAKERYQIYSNKMKSGSLQDSAEVVCDLILLNKEKSLNTSEKQLFNTAHKYLAQEVSLIKNISETEASDFLNLNLS